jgi:hypothetical protein
MLAHFQAGSPPRRRHSDAGVRLFTVISNVNYRLPRAPH